VSDLVSREVNETAALHHSSHAATTHPPLGPARGAAQREGQRARACRGAGTQQHVLLGGRLPRCQPAPPPPISMPAYLSSPHPTPRVVGSLSPIWAQAPVVAVAGGR
jgi:hypothetical protein